MKQRKILTILAVGIIILSLVAGMYVYTLFFSRPVEARYAIDTNATDESVSYLSNAMNSFCFNLYAQLAMENEGNVFFSPYSIFVALAMTYEGARNLTADEMYEVLGFQQNDDTMLCSFGKIYNLLNHDIEYTLNTANAVWKQQNFPFLPEYLRFLENYYMAQATDLDFTDRQQAADQINQWVNEQTQGMIDELLKATDIAPLTMMVLTNAIYFKGTWAHQFDTDDTQDEAFYVTHESSVTVPMMHLSDVTLNFTESDMFQMVKLPYEGDDVSMIILLPKNHTLSQVEEMISIDNISQWQQEFSPTKLELAMPRFTLETEYYLKDALMTLGMPTAFTEQADFSGMNGQKNLFIEKVKHQAIIEVNEEGTEAAGATSVNMALTAIPNMTIVNIDHPFLFFIQHEETGTILFYGSILNPTE